MDNNLLCPICLKKVVCVEEIYSGPYVRKVDYGEESTIENVGGYQRVTYVGSYVIECEKCNLSLGSPFRHKKASEYGRKNIIKQWRRLCLKKSV